jgi:hypothetical protein
MSSPRHLWSGDWRRDSDAAADELAKRRAGGTHAPQRAPAPAERPRQPATPVTRRQPVATPKRRQPVATPKPRKRSAPPRPPRRPREPALDRAIAALRRIRERLPALRPPSAQHRRLALVIVLAALVLAGAVYGLSALGGSGSPTASALATGRPWLGVELSNPIGGGVIVTSVAPGGPADRAGIEPGDVVMQIGNRAVNSPNDIDSAIQGMNVGDRVQIVILRGATTYTTVAKLAGAPAGTP